MRSVMSGYSTMAALAVARTDKVHPVLVTQPTYSM
jgi:hypothetical protein